MNTARASVSLSAFCCLLVSALLSACGESSADTATSTSQALSISGTPTAKIEAEQTYAFRPSIKGTSDSHLTFRIHNAPAWAIFVPATGELSGTPTTSNVGTYSDIVISADDGTTSADLPPFGIQVIPPDTAAQSSAPTVTLRASPTTVSAGSASTLTWSSTGVTSCTAADGWTGKESPTGTASTGDLSGTTTFTLTCVNSSGESAVQSVTVTVSAVAPTNAVSSGSSTSTSTSSSSSTSTTSSGSTSSGSNTASGAPTSSVGGSSGSGTATKGSVTLQWNAPTANTDGTALTNLSGYEIEYGTESMNYTSTIQVSGAGTTSYTVDNLPAGTYYFSIAAINSSREDSALAPEVAVTVN